MTLAQGGFSDELELVTQETLSMTKKKIGTDIASPLMQYHNTATGGRISDLSEWDEDRVAIFG